MSEDQKYILGISAYFHDSAAVLLKGNIILAGAQEERFSRKKGDASFPHLAINYCLSFLPSTRKLDAVAFYENPVLKLDRVYKSAFKNYPRGAPIWLQTLKTTNLLNNGLIQNLRDLGVEPKKIFFAKHHLSHAASAYYPSGFDESAILVADGVGEWATTSIFHGVGDRVNCIKELRYPHSLGLFYSAFTQYCGFKVNSGEYKLMGLAPFGRLKYKKLICENLIDVKEDGSFQLNLDYFSFMTDISTINPLFGELFGELARHPSQPITQHYRDVAASAQAVTEEVMGSLARSALKLTGSKNICIGGGVALNCVANSHIINTSKKIKNIWIQPAAGDAGGALGAALVVGKKIHSIDKVRMSPFLGPSFSRESIKKALDSIGAIYTYISDESKYMELICNELANKQVVGHFDDRMEFGPRALGNRSILADPRPKEMLRKVNMKIKFREPWRPFAPAILESESRKYFDGCLQSPHMLLTAKIKLKYRKNIDMISLQNRGAGITEIMNQPYSEFPAISHCDYSSRLQTVDDSNGRFYRILTTFYKITDCPMLLNTSFNIRGEPIVCSPEDAISCFFNTHMDVLAIGQFFLKKSMQDEIFKTRIGKIKFDND